MAEATERLALLEQQVQRAVELIERLRAENARLTTERAELAQRMTGLEREAAAARSRGDAMARLEAEHRRLVEERLALLGHVESMLKDLAKLDL
jgi:FtsZ-binding cell division protein ZapB